LGRTLIPSDAPEGQDPQPVAVLSYSFWQRHFNGDPSVVGRTIQLVHKTYTIVGVMPSRFAWQDADVYLPLKVPGGANDVYDPTIRLRPGVTYAAANAELQPLLEQFAKETPRHFPKKFRVHLKGLNEQYVAHLGHSLFLLFGAVGLLLVIGCANVSILLLARGTARQQELAVRSAIGASRWRIERQLLTEALALSLAGALGGIVLAYRLLTVLVRWLPEYSFPHEAVIRINLPVLAFSVAAAIVTGALAGISPAFQFSRPNISLLVQSRRAIGGVQGKRAHGLLVMGQIALTLLLLTSAAAAINGFACPWAFRYTRTPMSDGKTARNTSSSFASTLRACRRYGPQSGARQVPVTLGRGQFAKPDSFYSCRATDDSDRRHRGACARPPGFVHRSHGCAALRVKFFDSLKVRCASLPYRPSAAARSGKANA
jgi:putative ABC transport system permease protein